MRLDVTFREASQTFVAEFGEVNDLTDGGYDRGYGEGYAAGEVAGEATGYEKGHAAGYIEGEKVGEVTGYEKGYPAGEAAGYVKGETAGYENGYTEGETAGEAKHTARYATTLVTGDGTNVIAFKADFAPDCFFVTAHGADAVSADNAIMQMIFDARSFARYGGMYRARRNGANSHGTMASASGGTYFRWKNGICEIEVPASLSAPYISGAQYICSAVKYTDKSDRELLEEEIALLTDNGGTIEYSSARVFGTVTEAEWQTLIATKPNRTFALK